MTETGPIPIEDRTTRENPWPGLRSYDEEEQDFFHGRPRETIELMRLVRRDVLTVFFGISGIGKSSLLKAGLFPALRAVAYLPVRVRLNFSDADLDFGRDVIRDFQTEVARHKLTLAEGPPPEEGQPETMWEYFHRVRVWDQADPLTPVLVFDQFEEVFTIGSAARTTARVAAFLAELADLVENQIPPNVRQRIERTRRPVPYAIDVTPCRIVLALREDYLANLEGLDSAMPSLSKRNRFRLLPMTTAQALDAVLKPGAGVIREPVARQIVETIGFTRRARATEVASQADESAGREDEIEPFLLSLVCRELNARRQDRGLATITADLVQSSQGGVGSILSDFYDRCFIDQPPSVRVFIEDQLVGRTGFRQMVALADLHESPEVVKAIPALVTRRLLRIEEDRHGVERVELTHDVLTPIAVERRTRRLVDQQTARAWAEQKAVRRRQVTVVLGVLLAFAISALGLAVWQWRAAAAAQQRAEDERAQLKDQIERTEAAQRAAALALQASDELRANAEAYTQQTPDVGPRTAPPAQVSQLQYSAQTELAASNRIGSYASKGDSAGDVPSQAAPARRVYLQVRSDQEADRARQVFMPLLRSAGYVVARPEVLPIGPDTTEVRYFRPTEQSGAREVARILRDAGVPKVQVRYVQGFENSKKIRENHLEVWLAPAPP
jgi:hypothetical protein